MKDQNIISHIARHINQFDKPEEKKAELAKFKKLKPPTKQIKDLQKVVASSPKPKEDASPRFALRDLQQQASKAGLNLTYPELALALIWL